MQNVTSQSESDAFSEEKEWKEGWLFTFILVLLWSLSWFSSQECDIMWDWAV